MGNFERKKAEEGPAEAERRPRAVLPISTSIESSPYMQYMVSTCSTIQPEKKRRAHTQRQDSQVPHPLLSFHFHRVHTLHFLSSCVLVFQDAKCATRYVK